MDRKSYIRLAEILRILGILNVNFHDKEISVEPELFFRISPKDNVGLITEYVHYVSKYPYQASFTVAGVTFCTIMTLEERDFYLKQKRPPEGGVTNHMLNSSIA